MRSIRHVSEEIAGVRATQARTVGQSHSPVAHTVMLPAGGVSLELAGTSGTSGVDGVLAVLPILTAGNEWQGR